MVQTSKELELGLKNRITKGINVGCLGRQANMAIGDGESSSISTSCMDGMRSSRRERDEGVQTGSRRCGSLNSTEGTCQKWNWEDQGPVVLV